MTIYTEEWFAASAPGMQRSAAAVVPAVLDMLPDRGLRRVVDVGCGQGWWAAVVGAMTGAEVLGVDGEYVEHRVVDEFVACDLEQALPEELGTFDLAICLEVAEHLTSARAESFVADLCRLAPVVLFSAAIPGQGGHGHINCRWPSYWASLFEAHGFGLDDSVRWPLWTDQRIAPWYRQNLHLAIKGRPSSTHDVVHPEIWGR